MKRFVLILVLAAAAAAASKDDGFRWQDAAKEMDALPFPQTYIDSVKKTHLGQASKQQGLRKVTPGTFISGETLIFEVGWTVFNAGYVILSAQHIKDKKVIRIGAKAMSNNVVSAIYKVRDYVISWVDDEGLYPVFFEQHTRERKYKMDGYMICDHNKEKMFVKRKEQKEHHAARFTHDYLSLIYYARSLPLVPGKTYEAHLWASPKSERMTFKVHDKRETIQTPAGTFRCLRVEPKLVGEGRVYTKRDKMEIWVTDDERKIPVMVKSKAKIGSINAKLVQVTNSPQATSNNPRSRR